MSRTIGCKQLDLNGGACGFEVLDGGRGNWGVWVWGGEFQGFEVRADEVLWRRCGGGVEGVSGCIGVTGGVADTSVSCLALRRARTSRDVFLERRHMAARIRKEMQQSHVFITIRVPRRKDFQTLHPRKAPLPHRDLVAIAVPTSTSMVSMSMMINNMREHACVGEAEGCYVDPAVRGSECAADEEATERCAEVVSRVFAI